MEFAVKPAQCTTTTTTTTTTTATTTTTNFFSVINKFLQNLYAFKY